MLDIIRRDLDIALEVHTVQPSGAPDAGETLTHIKDEGESSNAL